MNDANAICLKIYEETRISSPIAPLCQGSEWGFEILMGPPHVETQCLFLGYQPGEWKLTVLQAREAGYESSWVDKECHYATADWKLAKKLREIFTPIDPKFLSRCVGLNAIYLRAKNIDHYSKLDAGVRKSVEKFCLQKNQEIINAINPKRIIVIGLMTLELFDAHGPVELDSKGKVLTKFGTVFGRKALAVRHLSGARFAKADFAKLTSTVRSHCMD